MRWVHYYILLCDIIVCCYLRIPDLSYSVVNGDVTIIQTQRTPLHYAALWGHTDTVALLTVNEADVNMKNKVS